MYLVPCKKNPPPGKQKSMSHSKRGLLDSYRAYVTCAAIITGKPKRPRVCGILAGRQKPHVVDSQKTSQLGAET